CAILIEGDLESEALEEALKKVLRKHEILRTTLDTVPGLDTPVQLILENPPLPYREARLSDGNPDDPPDNLEAILRRLFREEARPFEFGSGLLARFCLGRLSASKHILLISLNALSADSWTLSNLFKEIGRLYAAELEGKELSNETTQYLQFSEWQ